jgi:hypothetical protein
MKRNALVESAQSGADWMQENKASFILFIAIVVAVLIVGVGSTAIYQHRQDEAQAAFGTAMDTYLTPITSTTEPQQPGVKSYPSVAARAADANPQFLQVAKEYGMTSAGKNAEYFAGLTYMEMGRTADAQNTLQHVADHGDRNVSALARMALASLDQQEGRTADAVQLYKDVAAHPSATVPASEAQLALAALDEKANPLQAKQIYAQLKDSEKDTAAGQIASQKLAQLQ